MDFILLKSIHQTQNTNSLPSQKLVKNTRFNTNQTDTLYQLKTECLELDN